MRPAEINHGFIWRSGQMTDLNDLVVESEWAIIRATAINNKGQIVGWGRNRTTGQFGALLLNPPGL